MNKLRFEPAPRLDLVQADADVAISGWDQPAIELTLDGDLDQCTVEQGQDTLVVTSRAALAIYIPRTTSVLAQQVSGDLLLRALDGQIEADTIHGDVSIRGGTASITIKEAHCGLDAKGLSGPLDAGVVHGDVQLVDVLGAHLGSMLGNVRARSIAETLELGDAGGDITVRSIAGLCTLKHGHGSMQAHDLYGGLQIEHLVGDLSLGTPLRPGHTYRAQVEGEIRAHFPADVDARFDLRSNSLVTAQLPTFEQQAPTHVIGRAGAGQATVDLQAEGDLWVQIQGEHEGTYDAWRAMDSISASIEAEIAEHLERMNIDATTQREIDQVMRRAEQELAKAQHDLERETQRAQELAHRAQEKAAKAAKRAQERIARQSRAWGVTIDTVPGLFGLPIPRRPQSREPTGTSEEELLAILKMLQENKITVEQAEKLLKALEG